MQQSDTFAFCNLGYLFSYRLYRVTYQSLTMLHYMPPEKLVCERSYSMKFHDERCPITILPSILKKIKVTQ